MSKNNFFDNIKKAIPSDKQWAKDVANEEIERREQADYHNNLYEHREEQRRRNALPHQKTK